MLLFALYACSTSTEEAPTPPVETPEQARTVPSPTPVAPPKGTPLAALVATSGNALPLLDGDPKTSWRPNGHYANEGVLFRFETPTSIDALTLDSCGQGQGQVSAFIDGSYLDSASFSSEGGRVQLGGRSVRSVFLRVDTWKDGACLGEVHFEGAEVAPPRLVQSAISASSTLEPASAYLPAYLFDAKLDFGWVEGDEGLGIGASIQAEMAHPVEVHAIELWNGYQRSRDHFDKNGRAKRIRVELDGKGFELDVPDTMGPSKIPLPEPTTGKKLVLTILEATPGTKYPDLVLTEARLWDAEGPIAPTAGNDKRHAFGKLTRARGTAVERLVDYLLVSHCEPEKRQLKLRSNSSFVWYEEDEDRSEVFDGAWVFKDSSGAGSRLQLYGRRHRTESDWSPYGTGDVQETVKIAGGKPVFTRVKSIDEPTFTQKTKAIAKAHGRDCTYDYEALKAADAVLVEGSAFTDVLVKDDSRG